MTGYKSFLELHDLPDSAYSFRAYEEILKAAKEMADLPNNHKWKQQTEKLLAMHTKRLVLIAQGMARKGAS